MGGDKLRDWPFHAQQITIMGRSGNELADIAMVLDAHDIRGAKELNEKLGREKHPRIEVFDNTNRDRLLGTISRPQEPPRGRELVFHFTEPVTPRVMEMAPIERANRLNTIRFYAAHREKGWDVSIVLETSTTLADLLKLPEFRLPGETASQAKRRWEMQTFG